MLNKSKVCVSVLGRNYNLMTSRNASSGWGRKVALITGASTGIGSKTAIEFAKNGYSLALCGWKESPVDKTGLEQTVAKCLHANSALEKQDIITIMGDLALEQDCQMTVNKTIEHFDRLDVLVANAGLMASNSVETVTLKDYDRIMNINCRSILHQIQLTAPHLSQTKGNIVTVSSVAGLKAITNMVAYCVSKAALLQLTRCAALELAAKGIRVNSVHPGVIFETNIFANAHLPAGAHEQMKEVVKKTHPLGRGGTAEEVAKAIFFLASNDSASFITGTALSVDGGRAL